VLSNEVRAVSVRKFTSRARCNKFQYGFSLLELMVAMTIGLIISAGAAALFANTILSTKTLNNATQIQEAGSYATQVLGRHLRMAGYADWLSSPSHIDTITNSANAAAYNLDPAATSTLFSEVFAGEMALHGCANGYAKNATLTNRTCYTANTTGLRNGLTVSYQVLSNPNVGSAPSTAAAFSSKMGMSGDCNNYRTPGLIAVNRFYLSESNDLLCQGNGGSAQPLMSNVEQFVVTYAVAQANGAGSFAISNDLQITNYKTAAQIDAANEWGKVIAARICLLIAGETGSLATASTVTNTNRLDCNPTTPTFITTVDRRLRQVFSSTVTLRNQIHTASAIQP
jgi:type IV pilus assembly protein PilW